MNLELNSISKGNKKPIYYIQYRSNQGVKFAEMALNKINYKKFYLCCPAKRCKPRLSIQIRPPILVEVIEGKKVRLQLNSSEREEIPTTPPSASTKP